MDKTVEKRTVKVKFLDYWSGFDRDQCLTMRLLRKHYNVEVCDDADYVFFSVFGESHWAVPDRCVKIFYTAENLAPDFSACDYAIGFEWMNCEDRYIRLPNYLFYAPPMLRDMEHKHEIPDGWDLHKEKPDFCSFVVSNGRCRKRNEAFEALCQYRKVDSGGSYRNNIGGGKIRDKQAFERTHRFSLCYENGAHNGYTTEKLVQAFAARTVPIYWGDPLVGKVFNKKAFINAADFDSDEQLVQRVKEIDQNDELYMQILREPAFLPTSPSIDEEMARFETWLIHIFEQQPLEKAYRRNREMFGAWYIRKRIHRLDENVNLYFLIYYVKVRLWNAWLSIKYKYRHKYKYGNQ